MPITISGSTGIAGVDGSASTPAVQGTDTNTGMFFPAADTIAFVEGGTEVMRINSSGNVGIGTSSPGSLLTVNGNLAFNSGYGSAAVAYGCRAWVNFNGTGVVAIRASGNVTSITDNGTGDYTVNFTTAMPDANYAAVITGTYGSANAFNTTAPTTTAARMQTYITTSGVSQDQAYIAVTIFR
jgi:hypothetical protein